MKNKTNYQQEIKKYGSEAPNGSSSGSKEKRFQRDKDGGFLVLANAVFHFLR